MPQQRPVFRKTVTLKYFTLNDDLKLGTNRQQKGLVTRYTHVKYEGPKSYQ